MDIEVIPVHANIIYISDSEYVLFTTVGAGSDTSVPVFGVYGDFSDSLGAISTTFMTRESLHEDSLDELSGTTAENQATRAEYNPGYQGYEDLVIDGYTVGAISLFCTNELANGHTTTVYGKINTNTTAARSWLLNRGGCLDNLLGEVKAFRSNITLSSSNPRCHIIDNAYYPNAYSDEIEMLIPYITMSATPALATTMFITLTYVFSSIDVDATQYLPGSGSSNAVTWDMYSSTGWSPASTNGTQTNNISPNKGISVRSAFCYEGGSADSKVVTFKVSGDVDFMGDYVFVNGMYPVSFSVAAQEVSKTLTVTG